MNRTAIGAVGRGVEGIVTSFEAAWLVDGEAELAGYLPGAGDPDRPSALLELARVDMERRWEAGRPRSTDDYRAEYPELREADLADLAEAEARLRRDSGARATRGGSRPWAGFEAVGWSGPGSEDRGDLAVSLSGLARPGAPGGRDGPDLARAARSYLEFRIDHAEDDDRAIDSWADAGRAGAGAGGEDETVDVFVDLHRSDPDGAARLAEAVVHLPSPGDTFLGFRLIVELGRGAFGRVYLASQGDLADRPVALKVSAEKPTESQTLAQLQHTNIVPIFSAHRVDPLHAVCMPYFGSTTLKDIYEELEDRPSMPTSGRGLLDTLASHRGVDSSGRASWRSGSSATLPAVEAASGGPGSTEPGPSDPAFESARPLRSSDTLTMLGRLSYVEAVLWIGARLADGLAHAHGRGILHRDLKPANILLTDSGQPMLLDFNLSADLKEPASVASVGGTLPYMAPEHLEAFRGGHRPVDARSDIYALGIILYELLAGRHPFEVYQGCSGTILARMIAERSAGPAGLRMRNPQVSPAVESIVRHCLEPDPDRRYRSAGDLREDLERHMADLPLRHAVEPSTRERLGKWARRHPRLTSSTSVALLVGCIALGVLAGFLARGRRLAGLEAVASLARFRDEASAARYLLNTRVFDRDRRARAVAIGREALGRYGATVDPGWRDRPPVRLLGPDDRRALLEGAGALLLALARAGQLDAQDLKPDDPAREAKALGAARLLDQARGCFEADRAPRAIFEQGAELARILGHAGEADRLLEQAGRVPLRTALDHQLAASALALRGHYRAALPLALESTRLDPADFWAWLTLGICRERLGQDAEAAPCFGTCIALRPDSPFGWYNRAEVHLRRADYDQARRDFEKAAALDPKWPDPHAERAIADNLDGRPADAVRGLTRAIELGANDGRIYLLRSTAKARAGDAQGARLDREEGLRREPRDDLGWVARAMARQADDPAGALLDLDRALEANPRSLDALQDKAYVLAERLGRIADAEAVLDRAVAHHPDYVPSRSARGVMRAILGRREAAHVDARESLWRDTSPRILYQVAGIYAVTSREAPEDKVEAFRLLSTALRNGFGFEELAEDRELDPIRDLPEFRKLLEAARAIRDAAPPGAPPRP